MGLALGLLREDFTRGREGKAGPAEAAAGARVEAGAEPPGVGRGWGPRDKKGEASYEWATEALNAHKELYGGSQMGPNITKNNKGQGKHPASWAMK